jgi:AmmeMemoRadiSam system protein B
MLQKRCLPPSWYPETEEEVRRTLKSWAPGPERTARLCVVPHAGWFFSGELAWQGISALAPAQTVVILGGHLPPGDSLRVYDCDAFETPLGLLETDRKLLERLRAELPSRADTAPDNTVEVHLPLVKCALPSAKVVGLRVPPSATARKLGRLLARLCSGEGCSIAVAASTDLTHYGPNYDFAPRGGGPEAVRWVQEENDASFLEALVLQDAEQILSRGLNKRAACSPGAAAAAAVCAAGLGLTGRIARYATSLEKGRSSSFVGYGVVIYA